MVKSTFLSANIEHFVEIIQHFKEVLTAAAASSIFACRVAGRFRRFAPSDGCALVNSAVTVQPVQSRYATELHQSHRDRSVGLGCRHRRHRRQFPISLGLDVPDRPCGHPVARHDVAVESSRANDVRKHSEGTPMTGLTTVISDVEADARWRTWQARGAARDRRTDARMRKVVLVVVAALMGWFAVQLA